MSRFVLTRSAYGPAWDLEANRRRLAVTRAVTAPSMAAQTSRDWTWVVLLDPRDPLLEERLAVYRAAAPSLVPLVWCPEVEPEAGDTARQRLAAADYRAPWRATIGPEATSQTRLDDDDGLAPDAMERYARAQRGLAARYRRRAILMLPRGVRVWQGRFVKVTHQSNAMHTLLTQPGDRLSVYDYSHIRARHAARVIQVDQRLGWLWTRHRDTISGHKSASRPIDDLIRAVFPAVDWRALEAMT